MRCLKCNYVLDGLPAPRCPECGRGFDPNDPNTFRDDVNAGVASLRVLRGAMVALAVFPLPVLALMVSGPMFGLERVAQLIFCATIGLGLLLVPPILLSYAYVAQRSRPRLATTLRVTLLMILDWGALILTAIMWPQLWLQID